MNFVRYIGSLSDWFYSLGLFDVIFTIESLDFI